MPAKKQVTREMILDAALELLRQGGIESVNVSALAQRLGCSTQPIYLSFSGMDALRAQLVPEAVAYFDRAINSDGGQGRLYGLEYIRFAQTERELFRFLFMRPNAFAEVRETLVPLTERAISQLMAQYGLSHDEAHYFHDQLWMHAHGIAAMAATEFCTWDMGKVERMLRESRIYFARKYEG